MVLFRSTGSSSFARSSGCESQPPVATAPISFVAVPAGRLLGGTGSFTATLRGVGFAQAVYLLELLAFIPALSSLARLITSVLAFVATWIAGIEAHELRGWHGLLLPVARLVVVVLSVVTLGVLIAGAEFTVEALLRQVGLLAPGP